MTFDEFAKQRFGAKSRVRVAGAGDGAWNVAGVDFGDSKIGIWFAGEIIWVPIDKCEMLVDINYNLPR